MLKFAEIKESGDYMGPLVGKVGARTLETVNLWRETLSFSFKVLRRMLVPDTYNDAVRQVLINQIYFTAVQIIPLLTVVAVTFGVVIIGLFGNYLKGIGLFHYLGPTLMGFVVTEFAPFITVLLIALRSGSAINTEIAVMKVNRELNTLELFEIDVIAYLFIPRIVNGMVSVTLLSCLFSIILLTSGLFSASILFGMSAGEYVTALVEATSLSDLVITIVKSATFGFFIVLIPIRFGQRATAALTSIPISVLNGMVNVFIAIVFIEVSSLLIGSLIAGLS